ncbi:MAG: glucosaminidase domain-containing protein [Saprospiraceae bacterium]
MNKLWSIHGTLFAYPPLSMKSWISILFVCLGLCSFDTGINERIVEKAYIERFTSLAIDEMKRVGIPASITLAQAVVESNAGQSKLAIKSNNHFGIKCKSYWTGQQYYHKDDDFDKKGKLIESCFRAYMDIEASFKDHSDFLKSSEKYSELFALDITDYKGWAIGLMSSGYATDKTYALKLITIIEDFQLYRFDTFQTGEFDLPKIIPAGFKTVLPESTVD